MPILAADAVLSNGCGDIASREKPCAIRPESIRAETLPIKIEARNAGIECGSAHAKTTQVAQTKVSARSTLFVAKYAMWQWRDSPWAN
jgi:hypothetical protein